MRVHVSIHDVAPPFQREIELALEMARAAGTKVQRPCPLGGVVCLERNPPTLCCRFGCREEGGRAT